MKYLLFILFLSGCTSASINMNACDNVCGRAGVSKVSSESDRDLTKANCECKE